ncbi:MAG: hypothetical protein WKF86_00365 [Acidimicrobiales bacterium]
MADDIELSEAVCPTCNVGIEMKEQGGPFGTDTYACATCGSTYKYRTPPDPDWVPPRSS